MGNKRVMSVSREEFERRIDGMKIAEVVNFVELKAFFKKPIRKIDEIFDRMVQSGKLASVKVDVNNTTFKEFKRRYPLQHRAIVSKLHSLASKQRINI
ncbi:MAG: hypothetical protein ACE5DI_06500 [Candidatus Micrarchaeia archaeon]